MTHTDSCSPKSRRWMSRWLPVAVLLAVVLWVSLRPGPAQSEDTTGEAVTEPAVPVVVTAPQRRSFQQVLRTQGTVEAQSVVEVSPRVPGVLEAIEVDESDTVVAGRTVLFRTDAVKLRQAVVIAEHDLAVARCGQRQAEANREKIAVDLRKAEKDFHRFERLLAQGATTADLFEQQQSRAEQLQAAHRLAQAQVALAVERVRQAEAALAIARKDLDDTVVVAPISGRVTERRAEPGEMGRPGETVVRIEDPNVVEVVAFLPAEAYPRIVPGRTPVHLAVNGRDLGQVPVTTRVPSIDPSLRTFEIKCRLESPPVEVVPGAMAQLEVILAEQTAWGIPAEAVVTRDGRPVVFVVQNGRARQQEVQTGWHQDGWIALVGDDLTDAAAVVRMGQDRLDDGSVVSVQEGRR